MENLWNHPSNPNFKNNKSCESKSEKIKRKVNQYLHWRIEEEEKESES